MNSEQVKVLYQALFSASGPLAAVLIQQFGFAAGKVEAWLSLIGLLTPIIGAAWMTASRTNKAQVQAVADMPTEAKSTAVASLSVPSQASIAASLPDEAKIAAVTSLPDVTHVVVKPLSQNGVAMALANPNEPKVVEQTN